MTPQNSARPRPAIDARPPPRTTSIRTPAYEAFIARLRAETAARMTAKGHR